MFAPILIYLFFSFRVLCTKLGSDGTDDIPVFSERDSNFCVDITSTKDGKFITVNSNSRTSSEEGIYQFILLCLSLYDSCFIFGRLISIFHVLQVYVIDAADPLGGLHKVHKRVSGVQYFLEHHYGLFYILTNAPLGENEGSLVGDYYLTTCRVEEMHSANWQVSLFF